MSKLKNQTVEFKGAGGQNKNDREAPVVKQPYESPCIEEDEEFSTYTMRCGASGGFPYFCEVYPTQATP